MTEEQTRALILNDRRGIALTVDIREDLVYSVKK
jgi:hypothetical protein